jgi:hypothetical protein
MTRDELIKRYGAGERNFRGANLRDADLGYADLAGADLRAANLVAANLRDAHLVGANLRGARLPSPQTVLSADWGVVSDDLCLALMRFDAANHPDPTTFDAWSKGGPCPYDGVDVERAAIFAENKRLWSPGTPPPAMDLMIAVIREKCADSDWHEGEAK